MRLRTLLIGAVVVGLLAAVIGPVWWLNSVTPLSVGAVGTGGTLGPGRVDLDAGTVYPWKRHGSYEVTLWIHNSSSLPLTVTGADHTPSGWQGEFAGPTLGLASDTSSAVKPFHAVRIGADGMVPIAFTFHTNPKACANAVTGTPSSVLSTDTVVIHFEQVPGLPQTQDIPLGDAAFGMSNPTKRACAQ